MLIVDDNAVNRRILRYHAQGWGMECEEAAGGEEALARLGEGRVDVAVLDMQMPGMDGLMLAREWRSREAGAGRAPLVLLTSLGQGMKGEALAEAGISRCLVKPVKQHELYWALVGALGEERRPGPARRAEAAVGGGTEGGGVAGPRPLRILVAEDNPVNQKVALRQLQKLGYEAEAVSNGAEAVEAAGARAYDVILMDCQMPEMDGYTATGKIRRMGRGVRIIAMTANAMQGDREKCLEAGMDDYVSKPVRMEELKLALEKQCAALV
jgi:CheY-like chemotaxis protein